MLDQDAWNATTRGSRDDDLSHRIVKSNASMLTVTPVISNRSALQTKQKITSVSNVYAHVGVTV